jgi:hypothetical protein
VIFQNRIAHFDALIADMYAPEMLSRVGDECVYLILVSIAERTFEDLFIFAALAKHDPSMANRRWKSRFAKVQPAILTVLRFSVSTTHRKMLPLGTKRWLVPKRHLTQIESLH